MRCDLSRFYGEIDVLVLVEAGLDVRRDGVAHGDDLVPAQRDVEAR